ncbi:MAG: FMN-binding negative transcriptional regulator, partial [Pseudomonadota bacterium]
MYIQQKFAETRLDVLHALLRAHPLGAFVVLGPSGIEVNHFPFFIDAGAGPFGVLRGHIPKGNPVWKDFCDADYEAVVIFQGEESYITPSWYPTKHQHGQAVPTWNYATVHAYGQPRFVHDHPWLLANVTELTNKQEATQAVPWQVADAPADYITSMLDKIVGVEIPITRLLGKWKMSQNRPSADQLGVIAGLTAQDTEKSAAVAQLVKEMGA